MRGVLDHSITLCGSLGCKGGAKNGSSAFSSLRMGVAAFARTRASRVRANAATPRASVDGALALKQAKSPGLVGGFFGETRNPWAFPVLNEVSAFSNTRRPEGFRVKPSIRRKLANSKRRIERRLDKKDLRGCSQ